MILRKLSKENLWCQPNILILNQQQERNNIASSPFDELASEYDAWFDKDGSLFFIEVQNTEEPREGYFPGAGFTILAAGKRAAAGEER